jgi:hypothetical protein
MDEKGRESDSPLLQNLKPLLLFLKGCGVVWEDEYVELREGYAGGDLLVPIHVAEDELPLASTEADAELAEELFQLVSV